MLKSIKLHGHWIAMIGFVVQWIGQLDHRAHAADTQTVERKNEPSTIDAEKVLNEVRGVRQDIKLLTELVERRLAEKGDPAQKSVEYSEPVVSANATSKAKSQSALYFTAKWCGPCQAMDPIINKFISKGYPIQVIDIDSNKELTTRYRVGSIPTLDIVVGDSVLASLNGKSSATTLEQFLIRHEIKAGPTEDVIQLEKKLEQKVTLHFAHTPLMEVLREFKKQIDENLIVDDVGLQEVGVTSSDKISIDVDSVQAISALRLITQRLNLGYILANEAITVTSANRAEGNLFAVVYAISDLMNKKIPASEESKRIIDIICKAVAPESWDDAGGNATIRLFRATESVVIYTTKQRHDAIHAFLAALREVNKVATRTADELQPISGHHQVVVDYDLTMPIPHHTMRREAGITFNCLVIEGREEETLNTLKVGPSSDGSVQGKITATAIKKSEANELVARLSKADPKCLQRHKRINVKEGAVVELHHVLLRTNPQDKTVELYLRGEATEEANQLRIDVADSFGDLVNDSANRSFTLNTGEVFVYDLTDDPNETEKPREHSRKLLMVSAWHFDFDTPERRFEFALRQPTSVNFVDTPLRTAVDFLAKAHQIQIAIDEKALALELISPDTPVNLIVNGVTLRNALRQMLENLKLTHAIEGEVMMITTLSKHGGFPSEPVDFPDFPAKPKK